MKDLEVHCQGSTSTETSSTTWPLLLTFLGSMSIGTFLASFLRSQGYISKSSDAVKESRSFSGLLSATFGMLTQKKMLLLLSLLIYSGLQQAFIWYVHTILDKVTGFIIFIVEIWILTLQNFVGAI